MPEQGMRYQEAKQRITRIIKNDGNPQAKANLCNSILNQVRRRDGEGAVRELTRECSSRQGLRPLLDDGGFSAYSLKTLIRKGI